MQQKVPVSLKLRRSFRDEFQVRTNNKQGYNFILT